MTRQPKGLILSGFLRLDIEYSLYLRRHKNNTSFQNEKMNNFVLENSYRYSIVEMFSFVMKICEILIKSWS
jgi:hypothetical protein